MRDDDDPTAADESEVAESGESLGDARESSTHRRSGLASSRREGRRGNDGGRKSVATRSRRAPGDVPVVPIGRVTALRERRSGSARFVVEVDGLVVATVSSEVIGELGLRAGALIDDLLAERLRDAASRLEVFDKAIALLAVRARSVRDLQLRLRRAGAAASAISDAIDRLRVLGLLDDDAYARQLARSRALSGGVSRRRIGQELQRRGVARDVAEAAVADTLADVGLDEMEAATSIAQRRVRALRSLEPRKQRQRLYAFLARRGYEAGVIARVVASVLGSVAEETGDDE